MNTVQVSHQKGEVKNKRQNQKQYMTPTHTQAGQFYRRTGSMLTESPVQPFLPTSVAPSDKQNT